jgi:hypothetical protein
MDAIEGVGAGDVKITVRKGMRTLPNALTAVRERVPLVHHSPNATGTAIIGLLQDDTFTWKTPGDPRQLRLRKVEASAEG